MRMAPAVLMLAAGWTATWGASWAENRPSWVQNELLELALDLVRSPGSFEVEVGSVGDTDDGLTSLRDIRISDGSGVWMTVERLAFAWRPRRLLAGELAISDLQVVGATVLRAPADEAEWPELEPQKPWQRHLLDWPRAPIDLAIDRVLLERVEIRDGILPQAIRFDAEGRMHDRDDVQDILLTVRRTDAVAGEIAFETRRRFDTGTLRLSLEAREAAGGMVAAATGLPADLPVHLELSGEGPPDDWRLSLQTAMEEAWTASGEAVVDYAHSLKVEAELAARPGPALPEEVHALLGDEMRLTVAMTEQTPGQFDLAGAEIRAAALAAEVSGSFSVTGGRNELAVSVAADSPAAALVDELAFERLTFDGTVTGPGEALEASGRLAVDAPANRLAGAARIEARANARQDSGRTAFAIAGKAAGLRLPRAVPGGVGDAEFSVEGSLSDRGLIIDAGDLRSPSVAGRVRGGHDFAAAAGQWDVSLEIGELGAFADPAGGTLRGALTAGGSLRLAGADLEGELEVTVRQFEAGVLSADRAGFAGRISRIGQEWEADLAGSAAGVAHPDVPQGLASDLDASFRGTLRDVSLEIARLEIRAPLLTVSVQGGVEVEAERANLTYRFRVPDLNRFAAAFDRRAAGTVEASGRAAGRLEDVTVTGTVTVDDAMYADQPYGRLRLTHDLRIAGTVAGSIGLAADGGWLGRGTADATVDLGPETWRLENVRVNTEAVAGRSDDLVVATGTGLVTGAGTVTAPDLRPLAAMAGLAASGSAAGSFVLRGEDGRQAVASTLTFVQAEVSGFRLGRAVLEVAAADLGTGEGFDLRLSGTSGEAGPFTIETLDVRAAGPLAGLAFSGRADGGLGRHRAELAIEGQAALADNPVRITLQAGRGSIGEEQAVLRRPLDVRIDRVGGEIETGELDLGLSGGGRFSGAVSRRVDGLVGRFQGVDLPVGWLADLAQWRASGDLDVAAAFDTRRSRAFAEIEVGARNLALEGVDAERRLSVALSGHWDGARLELRGRVGGGLPKPATAGLVLPVHAGEDGLPRLAGDEPIDGTLSWQGNLADLWALAPLSAHAVEGDADLNLALAGTIEAPRLSGHAEITRGRYDQVDAGLALTDVEIRATLTDSTLVRLRYSAADGDEGRVHGDAEVRLGPRPAVDAVLHLDRARLLQRDEVTAWFTGAGRLEGPWDRLALQGELVVDRAEIRLIDTSPPGAVELDGVRVLQAPEEPEADPVRLAAVDVTLRADRDLFVRGRGLDSEWNLDLRATGAVTRPVLSGTARKIRGSLDLFGHPFELTRGEIVFDGTAGLDPVVGVSLERETRDVHGGIYVDGRLSKPKVRLASRSGLPSDEVLPRLLFGVSQQSLSGFQALQLSLGMARLLGHGGGMQDSFRQTVGLDVLRISGTTGDDAAVIAGKNLGDRVFVGTEQKIGSGQSAVLVEVTVTDSVTVDSRMEAGQGTDIGVSWHHDY